jgi:hypothetical protein
MGWGWSSRGSRRSWGLGLGFLEVGLGLGRREKGWGCSIGCEEGCRSWRGSAWRRSWREARWKNWICDFLNYYLNWIYSCSLTKLLYSFAMFIFCKIGIKFREVL